MKMINKATGEAVYYFALYFLYLCGCRLSFFQRKKEALCGALV